MKKVLYIVALASAMTLAANPIRAENGGMFVSVDAGGSRLDVNDEFKDRTDLAYGALGGYRWALSQSFYLGVEGGYAYLGKAKSHTVHDSVFEAMDGLHTTHSDERRYDKTRAVVLGLNVRWELPHHWAVTARGGRARYKTNFVIESHSSFDDLTDRNRVDIKHSNDDYYYGVGVGYDITDHFGLTLTYDSYAPVFEYVPGDTASHPVEVLGIRAEYRF